jgi:hypothetical protein
MSNEILTGTSSSCSQAETVNDNDTTEWRWGIGGGTSIGHQKVRKSHCGLCGPESQGTPSGR